MSKDDSIPEGFRGVEKPPFRILTEPFESAPIPEGFRAPSDASPPLLDSAGEAVKGAGQGLLSFGPAVAGALGGLKLGMATLNPFGAVAGMVAGGIGGYYAGQSAEDAYKSFFPEPTNPTLRAFREAGKTFGSSLPASAAVPFLPTMTGNRVSRFVTGLRDAAVRNPKSFQTAEVLAALGAGTGAGIAESVDPGAPGTRFAGEVLGGLVLPSPATLIVSQSGLLADGLKRITSSFGESSREAAAAKRLTQILEEFGEDIPALIRALEANMPIDQLSKPGEKRLTPSSAQKTDSLGLTALESALGQGNKKFLGEVREQGRQSAQAYQLLTERLQNIGTPEALAMSAQLQEGRFNAMLGKRLEDADKIAALKISKFTQDTPEARQAIGTIVKEQTETALRDARDYESNLWTSALDSLTKPVKSLRQTKIVRQGADAERIFERTGIRPKVTITDEIIEAPSITAANTANGFVERASTVGQALYDKAIPDAVRDIMKAMGVDQDAVKRFRAGRLSQEFIETGKIPERYMPKVQPIGVDELVNYRSTLLKMSREAAGKGDVNNANFYGTMAEGMLQDLSSLKNPAFEEARQFSKSLNDVFTRSFANTVGGVTKSGAERLPAEILVNRAFGSNADMTAMRMNELEDAVKFMSTQYDSAVARFGAKSPEALALKPSADVSRAGAASMADAQQRVLRMGAAAAVDSTFDPATGREVTRLNTTKLKKFVTENKPMLDKLGITGDLTDAVKAENAFRMVQNENSALMKRAGDQYAFGQVLKIGNERPSLAIGSMLSGNNPVRDMKNLVKMAMDSDNPEAAVRGLKHSLYDYAYTKASGSGGKFSPQAFEDAFFQPLGPKQPSVVNVMRANGLMTLTEMKNLKRLTDPMTRIERSMAAGRTLDQIVPGSTAMDDLVQSVIGARIGAAAVPGGPASLIAASAGSKAVKNIFSKMPGLSTVAVLERAAQDPAFAALLLKKAETDKEKVELGRRLHSYLYSAGLNYATYEEPEVPPLPNPRSPIYRPGQAAQQLRELPSAPSTRGVPGFNPAPKPSGAGASSSSSNAPASPNARSQFQALFPFDSVSGLAAQQSQQQQQPPAPR